VVEIATPGWVCGFGDHGEYDASCEAASAATVLAYRRCDFHTPGPEGEYERLAKQVEEQVCSLHEHQLALGQKSALERLAAFLLRFLKANQACDSRAACGGHRAAIKVPMTREQIADYLGIGLETVSRAVTDLQNAGFIVRSSNRREFLLNDICGLRRMTLGAPR
jgi:CRP-like cAMP-binding protein